MHDSELILLAGALLTIGIVAAKLADRVRVPGLLFFLVLGMLAGSEGLGGLEFGDAELTRTLGTIGLVLILFEGGLSAGWPEIRPVVGTAISLAVLGTFATAAIAGLAAIWLLGLGTLEGLIIGSAVAATDSAAIFAVLRGSRLRRRLARSLEGESGMNDPVALLLVTGFIEWIQEPGFGASDMIASLAGRLVLGLGVGLAVGYLAREGFRRIDLPSQGLYPVASIATAGLAYGLAELALGSGFLSVYVAALVLGTGTIPARRTTVAFHQGVSWFVQITLFFVLGLLVSLDGLADVAGEGLLLSAVLMFVARPLAALMASGFAPLDFRERLMLGWAGLRGAIPIWLATFPVVAGVNEGGVIFNVIFFVVLTSTLIQGATFEPLARILGLTTTEPALPAPIHETGTVRQLGGEVVAVRIGDEDAAAGRMIRELGLPRDALVNVIVRDGTAIPPRGSTEVQPGDELHILVRQEAREGVESLIERWRSGPVGEEPPPSAPLRGAPAVFTSRRWRPSDGDPASPESLDGVDVQASLRSRRDARGALVLLTDGRFAVTGGGLVAIGPRRPLAAWCVRRSHQPGISPQERAWWQEVVGALTAYGSAMAAPSEVPRGSPDAGYG